MEGILHYFSFFFFFCPSNRNQVHQQGDYTELLFLRSEEPLSVLNGAFHHQLRYPWQQQLGALSEGQPWALHHARRFPGEILVRRMLPDLETQKLRYHLGPLTQVSKMPLSFSPEPPLFLILSQWEKRKASKHLLPCCVVPENIGGVKQRHRAGSADSDIIKPRSDLTFMFPVLSHRQAHHTILVAGDEDHISLPSRQEGTGLLGWFLPPSAYSASSPCEQGAAGLSELEPKQINSMKMWRRR